MPKFKISLLLLILCLVLGACGINNQNLPADREVNILQPAVTGDNLVTWMHDGSYYMEYYFEMAEEGQMYITHGYVAFLDKDNFVHGTEVVLDGKEIKNRILIKDGLICVVDDVAKVFVCQPAEEGYYEMTVNDYSQMEFMASGKGQVQNKTLLYDEYQTNDSTIRYYYENGQVYAMETIVADTMILLIIENASPNLPPGVLDIPAGYTEIV